jgi:hypothetical protein
MALLTTRVGRTVRRVESRRSGGLLADGDVVEEDVLVAAVAAGGAEPQAEVGHQIAAQRGLQPNPVS